MVEIVVGVHLRVICDTFRGARNQGGEVPCLAAVNGQVTTSVGDILAPS